MVRIANPVFGVIGSEIALPDGWTQAALIMSFFSTWVVIGVFGYLNRFTNKPYFSLWTTAWLFYSLWLLAVFLLNETPDMPWLVLLRRACLGLTALFMFWGSFELTGSLRRTRRELGWGIMLVLVWSYVAAYHVRDQFWITGPMYVLLASASLYTGWLYRRLHSRYKGAGMLATGFIVFGVYLLSRPLIDDASPILMTLSSVLASILAVYIALSMIVQVLEEGNAQNGTLLEEFKRGMAARRVLENEVSISEQKYRALFDSASDAIFIVDLETLELLEHNFAAQVFVGDKVSDSVGRSFVDFCPALRGFTPGSLLEAKRHFDEVIGSAREIEMQRADGDRVPCEGTCSIIQYNRRSALQINVREITERKRFEQQLRRAEKLSALGQLTAGVAHEINNPLAVIMGYSQMLVKQPDLTPQLKLELKKILRESERAAKIVRNLLAFARPRDPQMLSVDLNRLVANILETYEAEFEAVGVQIHAHLTPDLPKTVADPHQIEQVIANIVVNALQAMADWNGPRELTIATVRRDQTIVVTIGDTGPGMPAETVTKIFDPFFTTKDPGKGTGLGLSISHSIIHEHRGRLWVQSEPGHGAEFHIELPLITRTDDDQFTETPVAAAPATTLPAGMTHRLLFVDDEPGILEVMRAIFSGGHYVVDTAPNGNAALDLIAQNHYDLIVSDLCMPGVDGEALYRRIKGQNPGLASRMIFLTGDTVSTKSRSFLEWTGNRWFSKPFNIAEIEETVANFFRNAQQPSPV
jgi:PAS domain S-box-containing protein